MGTELPTKVMLGQTLVLMQMTFLNNVRKVGRLVLPRTSCLFTIIQPTQSVCVIHTTMQSRASQPFTDLGPRRPQCKVINKDNLSKRPGNFLKVLLN
jgi:hypothetical protein